MPQFLYYGNLAPLNRERHKDLRYKTPESGFAFARNVSAVPLTISEFAEAANEYVIAFSGKSPDKVIPTVLLGLRPDSNTYVGEEGKWVDAYRPAFVRMYPFVMTDRGDGQFAVCVDEDFEGFKADDGVPLFDEDGNESDGLKRAIKFLTRYRAEMLQTAKLTERIVQLDLLMKEPVKLRNKDGQTVNLQGMYAVNAPKLQELADEDVLALHRDGTLACLTAHLLSLRNMPRLLKRVEAEGPLK